MRSAAQAEHTSAKKPKFGAQSGVLPRGLAANRDKSSHLQNDPMAVEVLVHYAFSFPSNLARCQKCGMRKFISGALALLAASAQAQQAPPKIQTTPTYAYPGDAIACRVLSQASAKMMAELPKALDSLTTLDGWVVLCALKSSILKKSVAASVNEFPSDLSVKWQTQFNVDTCRKPHLSQMVQHGWKFFQEISFEGGETLSFQADCD